jgi:hypothetical protein
MQDYSEKELDKIHDTVSCWMDEFETNTNFTTLTDAQKEDSRFIVDTFATCMYNYEGVSPSQWNENSLISCCLNVLPRKISEGEQFYNNVEPVLSQFFIFLDQKKVIHNGVNLSKSLKKISRDMIKAAAEPSNWGPAKTFAMSAINAGVDFSDDDAVNKYMKEYNQHITAVRTTRHPRIGRNDPCICGSGKKYKKCCGK